MQNYLMMSFLFNYITTTRLLDVFAINLRQMEIKFLSMVIPYNLCAMLVWLTCYQVWLLQTQSQAVQLLGVHGSAAEVGAVFHKQQPGQSGDVTSGTEAFIIPVAM